MEVFGSISWSNLRLREAPPSSNEAQKCGENKTENKINNDIKNEQFIQNAQEATKLYEKKNYAACLEQLNGLLANSCDNKDHNLLENIAIVQLAIDNDPLKFLKSNKLSHQCLTFLRTSDNFYQKYFNADSSNLLINDFCDESNNDYDVWARKIYNRSLAMIKYDNNNNNNKHIDRYSAIYLLEAFLFTHAFYDDKQPNRINKIVFDNVCPQMIAKIIFLLIVIYVEKEFKYKVALDLITFYCDYCNKMELPLDFRIRNLKKRSELLLNGKLSEEEEEEATANDNYDNGSSCVQNRYLKYHLKFLKKNFSYQSQILPSSLSSCESDPSIELACEALKHLSFPERALHLCEEALKIVPRDHCLTQNAQLLSLSTRTFDRLQDIYDIIVSESNNPLLWGRFGELRLSYCYKKELNKHAEQYNLLKTSQFTKQFSSDDFSALRLLHCGSVRIRIRLPLNCFENALKAFEKISEKYCDVNDTSTPPAEMLEAAAATTTTTTMTTSSSSSMTVREHYYNELIQGLEGIDFSPHSVKYHLACDSKYFVRFWTHMKISLGYCYLSAGKHTRSLQILRPFIEFESSSIDDGHLILLAHLYTAETCFAMNRIKQAYQLLDIKSLLIQFKKCNITVTPNVWSLCSVFAFNLLSCHVSLGMCNRLNERIATSVRASSLLNRGTILSLSIFEHVIAGNYSALEETLATKKLIIAPDSDVRLSVVPAMPLFPEEKIILVRQGWNDAQLASLISDGFLRFGEHSVSTIFNTQSAPALFYSRLRRLRSQSCSLLTG